MFDLYCSKSLPLIPSNLFSLQGEGGIVSIAVAEHPVYSRYLTNLEVLYFPHHSSRHVRAHKHPVWKAFDFLTSQHCVL